MEAESASQVIKKFGLKKASTACEQCKRRKRKCSTEVPCDGCSASDLECVYSAGTDKRRKASMRLSRLEAEKNHKALSSLFRILQEERIDEIKPFLTGGVPHAEFVAYLAGESLPSIATPAAPISLSDPDGQSRDRFELEYRDLNQHQQSSSIERLSQRQSYIFEDLSLAQWRTPGEVRERYYESEGGTSNSGTGTLTFTDSGTLTGLGSSFQGSNSISTIEMLPSENVSMTNLASIAVASHHYFPHLPRNYHTYRLPLSPSSNPSPRPPQLVSRVVEPRNFDAADPSITTLFTKFRDGGRHAISLGASPEIVLGPEAINLEPALRGRSDHDLLTPATWACQLQQRYEGLDIYVRLSWIYFMTQYLRFSIFPSSENYHAIPGCMKPTQYQYNKQHHAAIDLCHLPALRDILIENDHVHHQNDRDDIPVFQVAGLQTNWTGCWEEAIIYHEQFGYRTLTTKFIQTVSRVEFWTAGSQALRKYPGLLHHMLFVQDDILRIDSRDLQQMAVQNQNNNIRSHG